MLVAFIIAQRLGVMVEPLGSKPYPRGRGRRLRAASGLDCRLTAAAPPQHRAAAGQEFAYLAGLGQIVVGAELEANHAVDRARGRGEHNDWDAGAPLEIADDRQPV